MKNILITGVTGKAGGEVLKQLHSLKGNYNVYLAVNNIDRAKEQFPQLEERFFIYFDFEDEYSFRGAFNNMDTIFLIKPGYIFDIDKYYVSLLKNIKESSIREIVFLSLQGADKSRYIPHKRIEKLIVDSKIDYVFLRPSYFMQNLYSPIFTDIKQENKITLPAGLAKFNLVDVKNISEIAVHVIIKFKNYKNNIFEISGNENFNFYEIVDAYNQHMPNYITYESSSIYKFIKNKRRQGLSYIQIVFLLILHFVPRFKEEPQISNSYFTITSKQPTSFYDFLQREKSNFTE